MWFSERFPVEPGSLQEDVIAGENVLSYDVDNTS